MATKRSAKERRRSRRRAAMVLVPTVAGVFIAGTAFAYWSTSGSGTGSAATGTSQTVTVAQTNITPIIGLAPGSGENPISFKITNPKSSSQYIASVLIGISSITKISDGTTATGCLNSDFTITQPGGINADLIPGDTAFTGTTASIRMNDTALNQDPCKNVNVNLSFTAA